MNIAETLTKNNQTHILDALNRLSGAEHDKLLKQIEAIDWDHLSTLIQDYVMHKPVTEIPADLAPASYFPLVPKDAEQEALYKKAFEKGVELIRAGKTAALTPADRVRVSDSTVRREPIRSLRCFTRPSSSISRRASTAFPKSMEPAFTGSS